MKYLCHSTWEILGDFFLVLERKGLRASVEDFALRAISSPHRKPALQGGGAVVSLVPNSAPAND